MACNSDGVGVDFIIVLSSGGFTLNFGDGFIASTTKES